jgi:hypothetical protein
MDIFIIITWIFGGFAILITMIRQIMRIVNRKEILQKMVEDRIANEIKDEMAPKLQEITKELNDEYCRVEKCFREKNELLLKEFECELEKRIRKYYDK